VSTVTLTLECRSNYSATSKDMKLVHWPLMGGLLHLVQRGGDWAGHRIFSPLLWGFNVAIKGLNSMFSDSLWTLKLRLELRHYARVTEIRTILW